ncbi:MAG: glycosyltransferase [Candidatus Aminicenantes bacterium]|nr:glycosyltransferase [Candidatus Aminicenantes bacterium]
MAGVYENQDNMSMDISIVIPAFNEADKIGFDVRAASSFILEQGWKGEVIVVDDGSRDLTAEIARKVEISKKIKREVIRLDRNSGKGFALKTGILKSTGDIVWFADSGLCTPFLYGLPGVEWIRSGKCDLAIGSRLHPETVILRNRPLKRRILSRLFHLAAVLITGLPYRIKDSQCGFKLYQGDIARELYGECRSTGYLFELEIILRALKKGYKLKEFPIKWSCDPDTRLRPLGEAISILKELFLVRRTIKKP